MHGFPVLLVALSSRLFGRSCSSNGRPCARSSRRQRSKRTRCPVASSSPRARVGRSNVAYAEVMRARKGRRPNR
eukprot:2785551-Alexandrium_andersonii.AAC.1